MSENGFGSYNNEPTAEQYHRRRVIAGIAAALILLLLIWGMVSLVNAIRGGGDKNASSAVASTSASSEPFSDFSERPSASASASDKADDEKSPSADESASADKTSDAEASETASPEASETATETASPEASETASPSASAEASPSPSPSATKAEAVACTAADLRVSLTADQPVYTAGALPALAITYTNATGNPCMVGGDIYSFDINIISGPAQVYNSSMCQVGAQEATKLEAGATGTIVMTWNRQINALGCASVATAQPGYYWATATVNGVASAPTRIIIQG